MEEWWHIALRSLASIAVLFTIARVLGKKQISQLSFFEYITGIVFGELAGFLSTDLEAHFVHGLTAMLVWFLVPFSLEYLTLKNKRLRNVFEGTGTVFVQGGKVLEKNLKKERFTADELMEELRSNKVFRLADVEFAILEASGELSILTKEDARKLQPAVKGKEDTAGSLPQVVIMDGRLIDEALVCSGRSREWLFGELGKLGLTLKDVFLGQVDPRGELYIDLYEDGSPDSGTAVPQVLLSALRQCELQLARQGQRAGSGAARGTYDECASELRDIIRRVEKVR